MNLNLPLVTSDESRTELIGIQSSFLFKYENPGYDFNSSLHLNFNLGKESLPENAGQLDGIRGLPMFIGQWDASVRFWEKRFYFRLAANFMTSHISRQVFAEDWYENNRDIADTDGFFTVDVLLKYKASRNFQGYIKCNNLFNTNYGGIDATGTLDDLYYNPQPLRRFWFGLSYGIE